MCLFWFDCLEFVDCYFLYFVHNWMGQSPPYPRPTGWAKKTAHGFKGNNFVHSQSFFVIFGIIHYRKFATARCILGPPTTVYVTTLPCKILNHNFTDVLHIYYQIVAWWCNGHGVGLAFDRSRVRFPAVPLPSSDPGQVVHNFTRMCLCHQAVQFGTGQRAVMLCSWKGNRRSGVALAMRHRLQWFIHLRAQRLWEGDEHPTYAPEGHGWLYLF